MKLQPISRLLVALCVGLFVVPSAAGPWEGYVAVAAERHGVFGEQAARFLAEHRPPRDTQIDAGLLEENLDYALRARQEFAWGDRVPDAIFFNDVLPYASLDETRESWRPEFFRRCQRLVAGCATATEAAQALNRQLFNEINVHYNTGRKRPNQSPSESMAQGAATCTGLSIILVNACRAVGVPARIVGVANWADKRGNHTWVEFWDDGWHFVGADEYDARGVNRGWFVGDAARATPGSEEHAIWATSWRETGRHFPMVWNRGDRSVPAVDVTKRYLPSTSVERDDVGVFLRVWTSRGGERIEASAERLDEHGTPRASATTRAGRTDLNDMPRLGVQAGGVTPLRILHDGQSRRAWLEPGVQGTVDLFWDELSLSQTDAEALVDTVFKKHRDASGPGLAAELEARTFTAGDHSLRIQERVFGEAPEGARSLWISMHGGGGAPPEVNDQQWNNQIGLYGPDEGFYVAPRAPTDTWNLWHRPHIDALFTRLIDAYVLHRGVDPNRVYLMGYSAGGDGVYQLAPRMADRFAAAAMMAGHPNEARPLGLRNLPFALLMGAEDSAYDRNQVARQWGRQLSVLRDADPDGYPHRVILYEGLGHWMEGRDAEVLPWMQAFRRSPWPARVVWYQDNVTHTRFYWLEVADPTPGATITAAVDGQRIELQTDAAATITLRLRDTLLDLDLPISVIANGRPVFEGRAVRSRETIERSFEQRLDPATAATASVTVVVPVPSQE